PRPGRGRTSPQHPRRTADRAARSFTAGARPARAEPGAEAPLVAAGPSWETRPGVGSGRSPVERSGPGRRVAHGGEPLKPNPVKRALKAGQPQIGTWLSLGSVVAARFLARTGLPWLTVDMEHTHTDIQTAALMFGAIADAGCVPLARVPCGKHEYIKVVLDC